MSGGLLDVTLPQLSVGPSVAGIDGSGGMSTIPALSPVQPQQGPLTDQQALVNVARQIGADPHDLATVVHFESGFRPNAVNPDGIHTGLIQFGRQEQKDYTINKGQSFQEQLPGVAAFLQDRGYKPGMSMLDLYSTINAGRPGKYNAVDGTTTVADKVNNQMGGSRAAAAKWLGQDSTVGSMTAGVANPGVGVGSTAMQGGFGLNGIQAQGGPVAGQMGPAGIASLANQPVTAMGTPAQTMMSPPGAQPGGVPGIGSPAAPPSPYSGVASALQAAAGGQGQGQGQKAPGMQTPQAPRLNPIGLQQARQLFDASRFYTMLKGQR
jgi:hypothetical protein